MAHALHFDTRDNGALAMIGDETGSVLLVLMAYDLTTDDFGNSWASSRPDPKRPGKLNKITGKSHPTILKCRKWLKDHKAIKLLTAEQIKIMYDGARRPPARAQVWHVTGIIGPCGQPTCKCKEFLQSDVKFLYMNLRTESQDSLHDLSLTDHPESTDLSVPGKPDKAELDKLFDLICEICDLDPKHAGKAVGTVRGSLLKVGWTSAGVAAYRDWRKAKGMAALGSVWWLQQELAKKSWRRESRQAQGTQPDQADIDFVERKRAEKAAREAQS